MMRALSIVLSIFLVVPPVWADLPTEQSVVYPLMATKISSVFGNRRHPVRHTVRHHSGVDLSAPQGTPVRAVSAGTVVFADDYAGYGKLVTLQHENGYTSLYGHLSLISVSPGQRISAGEVVGRVGSTGLSTGPHLHFEWRKDSKPLNPLKFFPGLAKPAEG